MSNSIVEIKAKRIAAKEYIANKPEILIWETVFDLIVEGEFTDEEAGQPVGDLDILWSRFRVAVWEPFENVSLVYLQACMEDLYTSILHEFD